MRTGRSYVRALPHSGRCGVGHTRAGDDRDQGPDFRGSGHGRWPAADVQWSHPSDADAQEDHVLDTRPQTARAATRTLVPTGMERTFSADELIVSKTDPRGVIT